MTEYEEVLKCMIHRVKSTDPDDFIHDYLYDADESMDDSLYCEIEELQSMLFADLKNEEDDPQHISMIYGVVGLCLQGVFDWLNSPERDGALSLDKDWKARNMVMESLREKLFNGSI
jgi:hypothetical protein